jgi:hypothetical protein
LTEKAKLEDVEKLVATELDKLAQKPASPAELAKVKRRARASFVFGLQTNLSRATRLGEYESYFGDARLLSRELAQYQAVTAEDIQQAVKKYLTPERRQLVEVGPAETKAPDAKADGKKPDAKADAKKPEAKTDAKKPAEAKKPDVKPAEAKKPEAKPAAAPAKPKAARGGKP